MINSTGRKVGRKKTGIIGRTSRTRRWFNEPTLGMRQLIEKAASWGTIYSL